MKTAANIKKLRESQGLSHEELGEIIFRSGMSVKNYESGRIKVPLNVIYSLANHFKVSMEDLTSKDMPIPTDFEGAVKAFAKGKTVLVKKNNIVVRKFNKTYGMQLKDMFGNAPTADDILNGCWCIES